MGLDAQLKLMLVLFVYLLYFALTYGCKLTLLSSVEFFMQGFLPVVNTARMHAVSPGKLKQEY